MRLLLDTHSLIWLSEGNRRLGGRAKAAITVGTVFVSSISVWEIAIKSAQGRLDATALLPWLEQADFPELAFTAAHGRDAGALPRHHGDPFDRALVAQARVGNLVLVTSDERLAAYDVALLDAAR